jgi:2-polyprenyl-6-methoxyphenol hydroxylase-like FAD-dependent oxidoreductase
LKAAAPVAIIGGGPVGLVLALALHRRGVSSRVFERRPDARSGSRSIGIHPPSLELLADLGLAEPFLARGVHVKRGIAFGRDGALGIIDFSSCPGPYGFILAIPQEDTESILRGALQDRAPAALVVAETRRVVDDGQGVTLHLESGGESREERASIVIGADGKSSVVRAAMGVSFDGKPYPGAYVMGDFPDTTSFGDDAAVFLHPDGLVESFPLPGRVRRWVVRLRSDEEPSLDSLADAVLRRTRHHLAPGDAHRTSSFRAERYLARSLARGRIALAGDAAHVVSPIGGQGMNVGWLGAMSLADTLASIVREGADAESSLLRDAAARRRVAATAARRAEVNMWLGRPLQEPWLREGLLQGLLASPARHVLARMFTMRGLAFGV